MYTDNTIKNIDITLKVLLVKQYLVRLNWQPPYKPANSTVGINPEKLKLCSHRSP